MEVRAERQERSNVKGLVRQPHKSPLTEFQGVTRAVATPVGSRAKRRKQLLLPLGPGRKSSPLPFDPQDQRQLALDLRERENMPATGTSLRRGRQA
jgi:hypothetical protein